MVEINERTEVYFIDGGKVAYKDATGEHPLPNDTRVSMNFWGFTPAVLKQSEPMFNVSLMLTKATPKQNFLSL